MKYELNNFDPKLKLVLFYVKNLDPSHYKLFIKGSENIEYIRGFFHCTIDIPNDFPGHKTEIRIKNKIYHLNINPIHGYICAKFLNDMKSIFLFCFICLVLDQNSDNPYNSKMAICYKDNRPELYRIAKKWTNKYSDYELTT